MTPLGVFAEDRVFQIEENLSPLRERYDVRVFADWRSWSSATLLENLRSVEVAVTGRKSPRLPEELANDFGRLRWLCHLHGTIRHLASKRLLEAGLIVTNWGDEVYGVAEGALTLLLCQLKQVVTLNAFTKGGSDERVWQAFRCTLRGLKVGLYGFGPIGRHMARLLEALGADVAIHDPYATNVPAGIRRCASLRELFSTCQAVSIHCGLNDQTRFSVTRELLDLLPQGGIVVNTARGDVVDETALAGLVAEGKLLAGVDVIHDEGNWAGSHLAKLPGAVLTRHGIGGGKGHPPGREPPPRLPDFVLRNLIAYASGQPLTFVIPPDEYDLKT
jgi:phosphoglycerate dehydrogenase-like enzyme